MPAITVEALEAILAGDPEELGVHLQLVERDITISGHKVKVHCHCLTVDGNGRVRVSRLAEFMRDSVADYAVPRSKLQKARERDVRFNSSSAVAAIHREAAATFTDLEKSGEGGELLLFLLAERFLQIPLILCKMDLKTDDRMHYHGADGVYATVAGDGRLKLYWGESKVYKDATTAIRDCLSSLAPFLVEDEHEGASRERDLLLLSDKADLSEPGLTEALRRYFDRKNPLSTRVQYCGIALVGFDVDFYPGDDTSAVTDQVVEGAKSALEGWASSVGSRLAIEKLASFEIEFLCIPLPSVERFRAAFRTALGLGE